MCLKLIPMCLKFSIEKGVKNGAKRIMLEQ